MLQSLYPIFNHWSEKGAIWIISDTHFEDRELAAHYPRPATAEYIKLINSKVGKYDTLIHLGDVGDLAAAARLKGYKILIMGNHDQGKTNFTSIFQEAYSGPLQIAEKILLSHEPIDETYAVNLHGHNHSGSYHPDIYHFNFNADVVGYAPINFNQWLKQGHLSPINSIHRTTIDKATERKSKR